jgi:hypothetical protein
LANFPAHSADKFSSAEKFGTITGSSNYTQRKNKSIPVLPTLGKFPAYSADKFSSAEKFGTITASSNYTQRKKQNHNNVAKSQQIFRPFRRINLTELGTKIGIKTVQLFEGLTA